MKINSDIFIQQGILDCQIEQLIGFSHTDPVIKKFTSDRLRFKNLSTFKKWLEKGRIIYTLFDKNHNLLGIIWFGQKEAPLKKVLANFTFAIRIYGSARGKGLSQPFMKQVFFDFLQNPNPTKITGFWLSTSVNNLPAIHVYEKFGFKKIGQENNSLIMVL